MIWLDKVSSLPKSWLALWDLWQVHTSPGHSFWLQDPWDTWEGIQAEQYRPVSPAHLKKEQSIQGHVWPRNMQLMMHLAGNPQQDFQIQGWIPSDNSVIFCQERKQVCCMINKNKQKTKNNQAKRQVFPITAIYMLWKTLSVTFLFAAPLSKVKGSCPPPPSMLVILDNRWQISFTPPPRKRATIKVHWFW